MNMKVYLVFTLFGGRSSQKLNYVFSSRWMAEQYKKSREDEDGKQHFSEKWSTYEIMEVDVLHTLPEPAKIAGLP